MKSLIFLSPRAGGGSIQTGLEIRIDQLMSWFKMIGFKTKLTNVINKKNIEKTNLIYLPISTNSESAGYQLIENNPGNPILIDLYTPVLLEKEASYSFFNPFHQIVRRKKLNVVTKMLKSGSHFIVANRRQRNYWLKAANDLGVKIIKDDISVIPTSVPKITCIRESLPNQKTIVWFGGIYPWMNPFPLIDAFSKIASRYPDWKLRFLGGFQPKSSYDTIFNDVVRLSKQSIPGTQVEFIPWQKSANIGNYLSDVAFSVYLAKPVKNDYYAHGSRFLSLLKIGIPYLLNSNDLISDLMIRYKAAEKISDHSKDISKPLIKLMSNSRKLKMMSVNAPIIENIYRRDELETKNLDEFLRQFQLADG